jgi:hypothetical protein
VGWTCVNRSSTPCGAKSAAALVQIAPMAAVARNATVFSMQLLA